MNTSLSLSSELTIYNVSALHADWHAGLVDEARVKSAGAEFRVRADLVDDVDAAGIQLLLSLQRSVEAAGGRFRVVDPSPPLVFACWALGAESLLAGAQVTEPAS